MYIYPQPRYRSTMAATEAMEIDEKAASGSAPKNVTNKQSDTALLRGFVFEEVDRGAVKKVARMSIPKPASPLQEVGLLLNPFLL